GAARALRAPGAPRRYRGPARKRQDDAPGGPGAAAPGGRLHAAAAPPGRRDPALRAGIPGPLLRVARSPGSPPLRRGGAAWGPRVASLRAVLPRSRGTAGDAASPGPTRDAGRNVDDAR